jgi:hypothetical protein
LALIEEVNLKEKFCVKRALILCRSLLKQCRQKDENDQNLIHICETVIGPALNSADIENTGLALECVGLLTLLNKNIFSNYAEIFKAILQNTDPVNRRDRIIALKSAIDGLIVHGLVDEKTSELF